jgi:hypothetical protein
VGGIKMTHEEMVEAELGVIIIFTGVIIVLLWLVARNVNVLLMR